MLENCANVILVHAAHCVSRLAGPELLSRRPPHLSLSWHHNGVAHLGGARMTDAHYHIQLLKTFIWGFYAQVHFIFILSTP